MADSSFYGGKPGSSFVIVKSFSSIAEMVSAFKKGGNYTAVHYDEHVLINTENRHDPDNGKLYRRGYDYTNNLGGAIYIGTIVGPAGHAPMLELTTIEEVKKKQGKEGFEDRYTEGKYSVPVSLIPGKNGNTYNDTIEWACCCVRDEYGEDSTAYIGFTFPYTVIEFDAQSVNPYYNRSDNTANFINNNLIDRDDDKKHPFYEHWNVKVPKGITGDSFKNFRVIGANTTIQDYNGRDNDIKGIDGNSTKPREVLVYDYYHYDKNANGEPATLYLGDYNMIKNIDLNEEGTISIEYTHNNDDIYTKLVKWIKKITLDKNNGHFTIEYNYSTDKNGEPTIYETDLSWVKNITIAEDGSVTLEWSTGETKNLSIGLKWIVNMELSPDGTIIVNYNDGTNDTFLNKIQWISNVTLEQNGDFTIKYNNGTPDYKTTLKWVEDISIDDKGTITITYNNGDTPTVYQEMLKYIDHIYFDETDNKFHVVYNNETDEPIDNIIKFIENVYIDNSKGEDSDYKFHIVYNTGEDVPIGDPINYIVETDIDKVDYHFLVYYSNANYRKLIPEDKQRTYNGKDGWLDLGSIKDDSGVLIGFNIDVSIDERLGNIAGDISYLNENYPNGLTNLLYYGKIVTIGEQGENKNFYAFDYDKLGWYYLGTFNNDENSWTLISSANEPNLDTLKQKMAVGGVWFILEEDNGY